MNWFWYSKTEYIPYFYYNSSKIENAFIKGETQCQLNDRYIIDFISMTQINIRSGKERNLMRHINQNKPKNNFIWIIDGGNSLNSHSQDLLNFCEDFNRIIVYYNNFKYNLRALTIEDMLTHKKVKLIKNDSLIRCSEGICSICLENNNENSVKLSKCKEHAFHKDCIEKWFTKSKTCPICKVNYF
jgi:hypothetical protein